MSSTKEIIDRLKPYCGNWERSTGDLHILDLIQQAQDMLFDYDGPQMKYLGTDNQGWVPYLSTTSGTYEYEITAANLVDVSSLVRTINGTDYAIRARKVVKVFVDATNIDYAKRWVGQPYMFAWQNPYTSEFTRLEVADIPVESWQATNLESAKIIFKEDPGTSTDKYFVAFTIEPPRLTAETVPLILPVVYEKAVEKYVLGTIQELENGRENEHLYGKHGFYTYWIPKFRTDMSSGSQATPHKVLKRYC